MQLHCVLLEEEEEDEEVEEGCCCGCCCWTCFVSDGALFVDVDASSLTMNIINKLILKKGRDGAQSPDSLFVLWC
jgi:hypothetical protein